MAGRTFVHCNIILTESADTIWYRTWFERPRFATDTNHRGHCFSHWNSTILDTVPIGYSSIASVSSWLKDSHYARVFHYANLTHSNSIEVRPTTPSRTRTVISVAGGGVCGSPINRKPCARTTKRLLREGASSENLPETEAFISMCSASSDALLGKFHPFQHRHAHAHAHTRTHLLI